MKGETMMTAATSSDHELLRSFRNGPDSESGFRQLVGKYLGLVHGVALRRTGRESVAEDVAQSDFTVLARKSPRVEPGGTLAGWLYRCTVIECAEALRREAAHDRKFRAYSEHAATATGGRSVWSEAMPLLDEAIAALPAADRDILLQRFFERKCFRDIGAALGKSEAAAQKQGERALERLAALLARKGVVIPAALLAAGLVGHVAHAAPAGLAWTISAGTLSGFSSISSKSLLLKALSVMSQTKTTTAVAVALVAAAPLAVQWNSNSTLRREVADLRAQLAKPAAAQVFTPSATRAREAAARRGAARPNAGAATAAFASHPFTSAGQPSDWESALPDPDPLRRTQRVAQLLASLTRESAPDVAKMFDQLKGPGRSFETEHHLFLRAWGKLDGVAALAHTTVGGKKLDASAPTLAALAGWATADAGSARQWIESLAESPTKEQLIYGLLDGWSMNDLNSASAYAASRPRSEARNTFRELLLERALAAGGVPGAQSWFASIPSDEHNSLYKQRAFDEVIRAVLHRDPSAAAQWLAQQGGAPFVTKEPVVEVAARLAKSAPAEALRWLDSMRALPDGAAREGAGTIVANWAKADAAGASAFLQSAATHPQYDAMAGALARTIAAGNPQIAFAWAQTMHDESARAAAENAVAGAWLRKDSATATAQLRAAGWAEARLTAAQARQGNVRSLGEVRTDIIVENTARQYLGYTFGMPASGRGDTGDGAGSGSAGGGVADAGFTLSIADQDLLVAEKERSAFVTELALKEVIAEATPADGWHVKNPIKVSDKSCVQCHK
jgi:RNA polymerase sigma factor (sigma-70 family)